MSPHPACVLRWAEWVSGSWNNWRMCLRPSRREGAHFLQFPTSIFCSAFILSVLRKSRLVGERGSLSIPTFSELPAQGYLLKEAFLSVLIATSDNWAKKGKKKSKKANRAAGIRKAWYGCSWHPSSSSSPPHGSPEEAAHWLDVFSPPRSWEHLLVVQKSLIASFRIRTDQPLRLPFKKSRVPYQGLSWIALF